MSVSTLTGQSVELAGIAKSYGATSVLRGFDLTVPAGSFCTLLGASGSGKTTLLKLIAGFERPDAGRIRIGARDVADVAVARRNIGMVFQNYALFPHMRVRANVAFGLDMRRVPKAESARRVDEALALVGLSEQADRMPAALSGGQQQRVALARALVIQPDVLLMDEPLGALDKNLRQGLQLQLKQLQARLGVTIIFVTHDQEEAMQLSDTIVLLDRGRIAQVGSPREMYLHPASRFVATFLGECNCLELDGRQVGVRPERLRLGGALPHQLEAVVTDVTFLGGQLRIRAARVGMAEELVALVPVSEALPPAVGDRVTLGFAPADAMPLVN